GEITRSRAVADVARALRAWRSRSTRPRHRRANADIGRALSEVAPNLAKQTIGAYRGAREQVSQRLRDILRIRSAQGLDEETGVDLAVAATQTFFFRNRKLVPIRCDPDFAARNSLFLEYSSDHLL